MKTVARHQAIPGCSCRAIRRTLRSVIGMFIMGALVALCASGGRAAVVYVDAFAPGPGRDGKTWNTAMTTIGSGLALAQPGDTVAVAEGSYPEEISLKNGVWLRGGYAGAKDPLGAPDPRAHVAVISGRGGPAPVVLAPRGITSTAQLDGFHIVPGDGTTYGVVCAESSPAIVNNVIRDAGVAISCGAGSAPRIVGNILADSEMGVSCSASSPMIAGNLVRNCAYGIHTGKNSSPAVTNNTVVGNGTGLDFFSGHPLVQNNLIARNAIGVFLDLGGAPILRYNCVSGNTTNFDGVTDPTGTEGNIAADPAFLDADGGDYHLGTASPCIDAGDDTVITTPAIDLDARPRPQGAHVDIGAYEALPPNVAAAFSALRIAGGLRAADAGDMTALDVESSAPAGDRIDIADASRLVRENG
jgi:parallel beta-helix repeat protein